MSDDMAMGDDINGIREADGGGLTDEVIELRLPPKPGCVPVLRATAGVIAGVMSFNYDEITQIRVAASEAFGLAVRYIERQEGVSAVDRLTIRFVIGPDTLEAQILNPGDYIIDLSDEEEREVKALLESLADELEFGDGAEVKSLVRIVKRRSV